MSSGILSPLPNLPLQMWPPHCIKKRPLVFGTLQSTV